MERQTKKIKLSCCEVELYESFTWGESEAIQAELVKGAKLNNSGLEDFDTKAFIEYKYKSLEFAVKSYGDRKPFTREWMNNLSKSDGDLLYAAVEETFKKK